MKEAITNMQSMGSQSMGSQSMNMQNTNTNTINTNWKTDVAQINEAKSLSLNLETLKQSYSNLLVSYEQAMSNYVASLKANYANPCGQYELGDNVNEACYQYIWNKSGCTTSQQDPAGTWWPYQTMQGLISDSWEWSTMQDDTHRMGCYSTNQGPYYVIGVGTDGRLYSKNNLYADWVLINDSTNGLLGVCTANDGQTIYGAGSDGTLYSKPSFDATSWTPLPNANGRCCVMSASQGPDGTIVGVGMNYVTWSVSPGSSSTWQETQGTTEWLISLCIAPNGNIFCTNGNGIFMKSNYLSMNNVGWTYLGNEGIGIIALTIAPDGTLLGVGNDNSVYTAGNYQNVGSQVTWSGPVSGGGAVTGITTVANPNYNPSIYSTATAPNYNIDGVTMAQLQGATFWGSGGSSQSGILNTITGGTMQECTASCASTPGCTGATYNQAAHGQPYCWLVSGEGTIGPGLGGSVQNSDFAIVPETKQLLQVVDSINQQLINVNQQIQTTTSSMPNIYSTEVQERSQLNNALKQQYSKLQNDRKTIQNKINEYQSLENEQNSSNTSINQSYIIFFILLAIVLIGVIVLAMLTLPKNTTDAIKFSLASGASGAASISKKANPFYVIFGIILVIVIVYLYNEIFF
jgi:hypothetical protein